MQDPALPSAHRRRLRELWRSAGWPCHDPIELDLLAAGLLQRHWDPAGRETLRLSDSGLQALAAARRQAQAALAAHEALVARLAEAQQHAGRLVWRGLALRAPLPAEAGGGWALARPDVFSIRHTTLEDQTEPVVHEIKVSRADLLADLRQPAKGAAYRALASQCYYVLRQGIAEPAEVPPEYGVMLADAAGIELARPAPKRAMRLPFAVWMALARSGAEALDAAEAGGAQAPLAACETSGVGA
jgi:hypothetical protein